MKRELEITTKEQIAFCENVRMITEGFVDRLFAMENMTDLQKRSRAPSRSELDITKGFANDLDTLQHDDNQIMEASNEIGTEVNLRFPRVANQLERVEVHIATVPENIPLFNNRICNRRPG